MKPSFIVGLSLAAFAACDPPEPAPTPPATVEAKAKPAPKAVVAKPAKAAPIKLSGTPHDEEYAKVKLTWNAKNAELPMFGAPGGEKESGKLSLTQGKAVEFADSVVLITKPNKLTAKAGAKIFGASKFDVKTGKMAAGNGDIDVPAGDVVLVLKYAGEGMCFTQHARNTYIGGCPSPEMYGGNVDAKPEHEWWVQPKGKKGWLIVDERLKVDVTTDFNSP